MLGYNKDDLVSTKAIFTAEEIFQQPETWQKTINQVKEARAEIDEFLGKIVKQEDFSIIFAGAGTSEFIGNALFSGLSKMYQYRVKSYATTDLVAAPELYINPNQATLLISFGRSGSSPESVGAIEACNAVSNNIYHLFITCNKNGEMAKWSTTNPNCLAMILAAETCDRGFAMTSSYSNMMLCAYLCLVKKENAIAELTDTIEKTRELVEEKFADIKKVVDEFDYRRIVYLGSNVLKGTAQESALKMLELTAGKVVTMYDSPLGFRHGPKSIINDETLVVVFLSEDAHSQKYEVDLLEELSEQRAGNRLMVVCSRPKPWARTVADYVYCFDHKDQHDNLVLGFNYIVVAQLMALYKSLALGITPDNPCIGGAVNRVVKGVTIYPYTKQGE